MAQSPAEAVADFLEANRDAYLAEVAELLTSLLSSTSHPTLEQWCDSCVDYLRGERACFPEWTAAYLRGIDAQDANTADILENIRQARELTIEFCAGRIPGFSRAEICCAVVAASDQVTKHLFEHLCDRVRRVVAGERRRLGATAEAMDSAFVVLDSSDNIHFANTRVADLLGVQKEALFGKGFLSLCDAATAEETRRRLRKKGATAALSVQGRLLDSAGEPVPADFSILPIHDDEGLRSGATIVVSPQATLLTQTMAAEIPGLDALPFGVAVAKKDHTIPFANRRFRRWLPLPAQPDAQPDIVDVLSGLVLDAGEFVRQAWRGVASHVAACRSKKFLVVASSCAGQGQDALLVCGIVPFPDSKQTHALGVDMGQVVSEVLGAAAFIIDKDGGVAYANDISRNWLKVGSADEIKYCCGLHRDEEGNCADCFRTGVFESGSTYRAIVRGENRENEPAWLELISVPIKNDKREVTHIARIVRDVTERRNLENQLLNRRGVSPISQLAVGVAHELRNPLGVMIGLAEMLAQGVPPENVGAAGNKLLQNGLRCKKILEDLLEFGRELPSHRVATDVNRLIRERIVPFYPASQAGRITWALNPEAPQVECAPQQITRVITNLVDNALFAAAGSVNVETIPHVGGVKIRVTDDGPGVPKSLQNRIFEPFFSTRKEEGAVGLGLSLSQMAVRDHGGELTLADTETGACFVIDLPRIGPAALRTGVGGPSRGSAGKVLIVDDEVDLLEVLETALVSKDYEVDTAASGDAAIDLVTANVYDLIVLDVLLPGRYGGREIYHFLKTEKHELAERALFITADTMNYETRHFLDQVSRPYMEKPFLISEFAAQVEGLLTSLGRIAPPSAPAVENST